MLNDNDMTFLAKLETLSHRKWKVDQIDINFLESIYKKVDLLKANHCIIFVLLKKYFDNLLKY